MEPGIFPKNNIRSLFWLHLFQSLPKSTPELSKSDIVCYLFLYISQNVMSLSCVNLVQNRSRTFLFNVTTSRQFFSQISSVLQNAKMSSQTLLECSSSRQC